MQELQPLILELPPITFDVDWWRTKIIIAAIITAALAAVYYSIPDK